MLCLVRKFKIEKGRVPLFVLAGCWKDVVCLIGCFSHGDIHDDHEISLQLEPIGTRTEVEIREELRGLVDRAARVSRELARK